MVLMHGRRTIVADEPALPHRKYKLSHYRHF